MFPSDILKRAFELKESESNERQAKYQARLKKIRLEYPRLEEIDFELSALGASLMMSAISGKTEEIEAAKTKSEALTKEKDEILKKAEIKPYSPLCPLCEDSGRSGGYVCECVKQIAKELSLSEFKDRAPVDACSFEQFDLSFYPEEAQNRMKNIYDFSLQYAKNFTLDSGNILFIGKCGLGKTHLSLAIAKTVLEKGYGVVYGSAQDLFSEAEKEHFSYSAISEKRDNLLKSDLLILDDLGTEFTTNFTNSLFYNIVNTRILNGKPTIINTNLDFDELTERYSARIASRFLGEYTVKQFLGNDIRQLKAMKKLNK